MMKTTFVFLLLITQVAQASTVPLSVSGGSGGGDASAANQTTEIAKLTSILSAVGSAVAQDRTTAAAPLACRLTDGAAFYTAGGAGGSNAAAGLTGSAVPTSASFTGYSSGGNLVGVSSGNPLPVAQQGAVTLGAGSAVVGHVIVDTAPSTAVTNAGTFATQATLAAETTKIIGTVNVASGQSITANAGTNLNTSALALDATLTGGSQKAIVRGGAKGSTAAADVTSTAVDANTQGLDTVVKNFPASQTVAQVTGSNLHAVIDSGSTTAVTQATGTNLHAVIDSGSTTAVTQATGTNLHSVVDSGSITATQATGTNLHTVVDSGTMTANAGTNLNTSALALDATLTGGTQRTKITDGSNNAAVKAASTAAAATDPAMVVAISPNNTVAATQSGTWTLQPGNTANTTAWLMNVGQFGGSNVATGTGASGVGVPRVTVANDSNVIVTPPTLTKATQGATGFSTQDLKDAGRSARVIFLDGFAIAATTETLNTMSYSTDNAAVTTGTSYTVTAGKRLRIQQMVGSIHTIAGNTTAATCIVRIRANASGAAIVSSPVQFVMALPSTAAANASVGPVVTQFPDGWEFVAASGIGVTTTCPGFVTTTAAPKVNITITGYEY
jgi:hypothetical protein